MTTGDDDKGFKGLGKLGGGPGAEPPPETPPAPPPPTPPPATPPRPPTVPRPPTGAPPPITSGGSGLPGCLKIALILLGLFIAGVLGLATLGMWFTRAGG